MCQRRQKSEKPTAAYGKRKLSGIAEAEAQRRADRGGRIAGEIAEDLAAEGQRADPAHRAAPGVLAAS